jgi:Zn finger protein HypA/HybF involved in hydrogenase expression
MKLADKIVKCRRCAHEWIPRKLPVMQCPRCKSVYWNTPRKKR